MGQIGPYLRRTSNGHTHWCPGCEEMHWIPDGWSFDGNLERPTFNPSVKITGKKCLMENGRWAGEWVRDENGKAVDQCCHYFVHGGNIVYCEDSNHPLAGQTVPLPEIPAHLKDYLDEVESPPIES